MNNNLANIDRGAAAIQHAPAMHRPAVPENPLLLLHRYLRGRYPLAIILALVLGVPGGIAGYLALKPTYTSTGIIRIAPTLPRLVYQYEDNQVPPHFDSFVSTQASMLSNRRVLDLAASHDDLRKAGWPTGSEGVSRLNKSLKVTNRRGSELITAQVDDASPRLAQLAVNAVLAAYETVQDELTGLSATDRERHLRDLRRVQERDIESTRAQIKALALRFHTDDLEPLVNAKLSEVTRLESWITDLQSQLAAARATGVPAEAQTPNENGAAQAELNPEVELEYFVARDRTLARLIEQRLGLKTELESRASKFGPEHRRMTDLTRRLEAIESEIAARVAFIKDHELYPAAPAAAFGQAGEGYARMSVAQMQVLLQEYGQMLDRLRAELLEVGNVRLALIALKETLANQRQNHQATTSRLEQIEVENTYVTAGRVSVLQRGDLPVSPSKDRRLPLAVFGAMAGGGLGVGLVALLSLLQGGYRYIGELERAEGAGALLGTIPDLNAGGSEQASLAALSVHHLRNMLQMNTPPRDDGTVYTVSSATAGDGKTSLALSLAMSFAAMGNRTLLVDADLIGRGLSRQLALNSAPGLCQALKATTLNGELHPTRLANLWAIPVGFTDGSGAGGPAGGIQPEQIAQSDLRRILDLAREQFDTVIVDTGPILGSLEANLIAPMSDRVVLVVSRGQASKIVRSALDRLMRLGATCGGLVFNRAETGDFDRSISAVSVSGRSLRDQASVRRNEPASATLALLDAVSTQATNSGASRDIANA